MESQQKPTINELLEDYSQKPVQRFFQIDGFAQVRSDNVVPPDNDGRMLMSGGWQYELRALGSAAEPVRITIHEDATKDDVIALLRRAADWLEKDWYSLTVPEIGERRSQEMLDTLNSLLNSTNDDGQNGAPDDDPDSNPF